jgi:hypothetical protein
MVTNNYNYNNNNNENSSYSNIFIGEIGFEAWQMFALSITKMVYGRK